MSYRDDLAAALARVEALELEVARLTAENTRLVAELEQREGDAKLGRELRRQRQEANPTEDELFQERLREKMRREAAEVDEKIRAMREAKKTSSE